VKWTDHTRSQAAWAMDFYSFLSDPSSILNLLVVSSSNIIPNLPASSIRPDSKRLGSVKCNDRQTDRQTQKIRASNNQTKEGLPVV
jgi:hypothetical protein